MRFNFKEFTRQSGFMGGVMLSSVIGLVVIVLGYGIISNIKGSQSASAEQIAGSPESGVKSRLTELYDTLVAKNLGSDTDMSGMDALTDNWGAKWNRIKSAALKNKTSVLDNSHTVGAVLPGVEAPDHVFFTDQAGLKWSYPVVRVNSAITTAKRTIGSNIEGHQSDFAVWTYNSSGQNNVAIGMKTALQICQMLGHGWRMPTINEVRHAHTSAINAGAHKLAPDNRFGGVLTSTTYESDSDYIKIYTLNGGSESILHKGHARSLFCVKP